jgi:hypothetical protein
VQAASAQFVGPHRRSICWPPPPSTCRRVLADAVWRPACLAAPGLRVVAARIPGAAPYQQGRIKQVQRPWPPVMDCVRHSTAVRLPAPHLCWWCVDRPSYASPAAASSLGSHVCHGCPACWQGHTLCRSCPGLLQQCACGLLCAMGRAAHTRPNLSQEGGCRGDCLGVLFAAWAAEAAVLLLLGAPPGPGASRGCCHEVVRGWLWRASSQAGPEGWPLWLAVCGAGCRMYQAVASAAVQGETCATMHSVPGTQVWWGNATGRRKPPSFSPPPPAAPGSRLCVVVFK